jgi:hypothetical protein
MRNGVTAARKLAVWREYPVIPRQMHPRWWHQRRQARHQIQRLQHDVRGAISIGVFRV